MTQLTLGTSTPPTAPARKKRKSKCEYRRRTHRVDYNGPDSKFITSTQIAATNVAFRLEVNVARRKAVITSIFKWGTIGAGVTNRQKKRTIRKFKAQARSWSGKYRLKVIDPVCGNKTLSVKFRLLWSPGDTTDRAPYNVNLYTTYPRAGVTGWNINIGYTSDVVANRGWALAHEYGHTLCLADEYFYAGVTSATVTYKKADTTTQAVALEPPGSNIMKTDGSRRFKKRFYYFIAIEAQALLRTKSGRNVSCEIV